MMQKTKSCKHLIRKIAEVVDMKRVEQSMDWMNASEVEETPLETEE